MSQHTPGPWHTGGKHQLIIYDESGCDVAYASTNYIGEDLTESQANAAMMAAAPDLLESLIETVTELLFHRETAAAKIISKASAAIDKANGAKP